MDREKNIPPKHGKLASPLVPLPSNAFVPERDPAPLRFLKRSTSASVSADSTPLMIFRSLSVALKLPDL